MQGSKLETAIKVHNPENNRTSLWTPEFFHNWLEQLREYYPVSCITSSLISLSH